MSDLSQLSILDCAELLQSHRLSSVELVSSTLERIARYDGRLNAFISVDVEEALRQARQCDREIAKGNWRGPLHGVPYAAKDLIDVAGRQTSCHSKIMIGHIAQRDAPVIARMSGMGAILVGKTALHEFATGGPSFDLPWPPARNPWNRSFHPGGSSSGSGVAVSAGFVPFALGTDTAGSVRHPASVCGIVGMKPTYGAIELEGCFPLSFSLDHVGLMTRRVHENAVVMSCMLRSSASQRMQCRRSSTEPFADLHRGLKGLRIGVIDSFHRSSGVNEEIAAATDAAIEALKGGGARTRDLRLSPLAVYTDCGRTILQSESFAIHAQWLRTRSQEYGARGRRRLLTGALITAERYVVAQQVRAQLIREFLDQMISLDVAVCASSLELPCAIDDELEIDRTYDRQARTPFNVLGVPAISIPIALSRNGLPIGLQIVGKPYAEGAVYRAALGLEKLLAVPMYPPMDALIAA